MPTFAEQCDAELFTEANSLRRLGYPTAAVMTARAGLDRLIRKAVVKVARGEALRSQTGVCLERLIDSQMIDREHFLSVRRTLRKLSRYCHGMSCDDATAVELITLADDARVALLTIREVAPCGV